MASEVDICNIALSELGEEPIIALSEDSKAARLCNLFFADTRDMVLREHPWNFAIKRASLARLLDNPIYEFDAQFQLPSDYIRIVKIEDDHLDFRVEGSKLLINTNSVKIEYTSRITDTAAFDPLFVEALALRLAEKMSYNLADNNALSQFFEQKYRQKMSLAKTIDGQEGIPRSIQSDDWINARL
ncbi:MAG: hypothetical protein V3U78_04630 [Thiotrichaceae bacterium]